MISSNALLAMSQVEISNVDPRILTNIGTVVINQSLPHEKKILSYVHQMKNPYCFISGDITVKVRFTGNGKTLSESLVNYFSLLKQK